MSPACEPRARHSQPKNSQNPLKNVILAIFEKIIYMTF